MSKRRLWLGCTAAAAAVITVAACSSGGGADSGGVSGHGSNITLTVAG